ncbi:hypothetical protein K3495_g2267 [Podosphaera aphanis]|nr:hypothetical protein K3495_g2267 [Podosphaera aphanis]
MDEGPTLIRIVLNKSSLAHALIDNGCQSYAAIGEAIFKELNLPLIPIPRREVRGASGAMTGAFIQEVTYADVEINGYTQLIYFYVVPVLKHPIILGKPWMTLNKAYPIPHLSIFRHEKPVKDIQSAALVDGHMFISTIKLQESVKQNLATSIFNVSIRDIDKALLKLSNQYSKSEEDLRKTIPVQFHDIIELWKSKEAAKLPPHRPGVDHRVELRRNDSGMEMQVPFGPLYDISRGELLVLRKTLNDLLDKGYIRASRSEAGAPVLFARKPGGGLRFCCDYRGLNAATKSERYPLSLISGTIRNLTKAKWFTKLDVVAALHKIRMGEEEWKTAFRIRYGSFEWLVTPFSLSGAPATFQRYMNSILRGYLDDFCTASIDDVLIYTGGSKQEHDQKVRKVLEKPMSAGSYLDPDKCEFAVKSVKYL